MDKQLSESDWKKFAKGRGLKDTALVKALAALEQAKAPEQQLKALDEIEQQSAALRKSNKGDKELAGQLDGLDKALDKQRKVSEVEARKAAAQDDGDDAPDLLTTKLIPLLQKVKKGEQMHVLLGSTGQEVAVLMSPKAISKNKRQLLQDYLQASSVKPFEGSCVFEDNAYTFALQEPAAGLAKKLKAALLKQTGLKLKVRVSGPDGVDDDGEPAEATEATEAQEAPGEAQGAQPKTPEDAKTQFDGRMAALEPRVLAALQAQVGPSSKIRALAEFAREKAQGGNFKAALQALDALDTLLLALPAAAPGSTDLPPVDYAKSRLAWDAAKKKVQTELTTLEQAILDQYRDSPVFEELSVKVREKLGGVLQSFAEDLSDTLDQALNAAQADERRRHHQAAAAAIRTFLDRAANDSFLAQLDANPFVSVQARATLVGTLGTLSKLIA
ncbi:hypothetical protein OOT46_17775 [Aquabacterium sp. A7-Y]|uniref:hypothetical protein n=1 Tax=Aquabacterium sp. A7-Y TaxID=1349605 RepID=UPI00223D94A2|nr:hypothetical protein [Aquabacterium sp. A7-Y]MCW7539690.1 hypothetical protein [Aquabacterium sp. A7-Y]